MGISEKGRMGTRLQAWARSSTSTPLHSGLRENISTVSTAQYLYRELAQNKTVGLEE